MAYCQRGPRQPRPDEGDECNDVYELLVDQQSDRGKEDTIFVDWDSPAALQAVIAKRISASTQSPKRPSGATWSDIAEPLIDAQASIDWLIQRSLMRPRYLIQLVHECIGHAATAGKERIDERDLMEGYRIYSLDIIGNTNFELRDVYPPAFDAVYCLIGMHRSTTVGEIRCSQMVAPTGMFPRSFGSCSGLAS